MFYFILLASPKNKQTNKQTDKQKERWQGHRNSCGQLQRARILKKIKTRNIKKHSDTRKTTAIIYIQQVIGRDKGQALYITF